LVADFINNMHIKCNLFVKDAFMWTPNTNGTYTTKSGYTWLLSHTNTTIQIKSISSWSWIWKLKLLEKHKFLFWLVCHNSYPTLLLLNHRNIAPPSTTCSSCDIDDETFLQCVRDCNFSQIIWQHVGFLDANFYSNMDMINWLKGGSMSLHSFLFAATV